MKFNTTKCASTSAPKALILAAMLAAPVVGVSAQPVPVPAQADSNVLTTVYAPTPPSLEGLTEGPEIEGIISARNGNRLQVTAEDGTTTVVTVTDETSIAARGGFLGLGRDTLGPDALLNGLPVQVRTRQWDGGLVASRVRFSDDNLEIANIVRNGTSQRFTENETLIEENAQAAEALRGRFGAIDQFNVKATTNVYFDTGRSNLSPGARNELCNAATEAKQDPNALLLVVGYTDSTGSQEVNQRLSEARASSVVNYLQQQCGWEPYRMLTPTGLASSDPAADNTTAYGKSQNRRVAVNVLVSKSAEGL